MSWYDGLTFEQVRKALETGKGVPDWDVPGVVVVVPNGYHDWLYSQEQTAWIKTALSHAATEPTRNQPEAELWRRLFAQLDRIEQALRPRAIFDPYNTLPNIVPGIDSSSQKEE